MITTGKVSDESDMLENLILIIILIGTFLELCCYVFFFGTLYFHDRKMLKKKTIEGHQFKRRRQINAMSFMGLFYGFLVECITYIGIMFALAAGSNKARYRLIIAIGFWVEFGISSIVEVWTSQNLRKCLPHIYYSR